MNHFWIYEGREYAFDISESECMARVNSALTELRAALHRKELSVDNTDDVSVADTSAAIAGYCKIVRRFFDTVFGEGEGTVICGEKLSAEDHTAAYMEFILFMDAQVKAFARLPDIIGEKYASRVDNLACNA